MNAMPLSERFGERPSEMPIATAASARRHSALAMEAARRMRYARRTREKRKTALLVCHHLRMMLAASG